MDQSPTWIREILFKWLGSAYTHAQYCDESLSQTLIDTDANCVFDIASITKLFIVAMVSSAVESGHLRFEDRVRKYLPNPADPASDLRLIDLLTHQVDFAFWLAGIRSEYPNSKAFKHRLLSISLPASTPWRIHYHNLGYILVGFILEELYGMKLWDITRQYLHHIGLRNTYCWDDLPERLNIPSTEIISGIEIVGMTHDESSRILGGMAWNAWIFSTSSDLVRFGQKWINGEIVSREFLDKHVSVNYDRSGNSPQWLGWWMRVPWLGPLPKGMLAHTGFTGWILAIDLINGKSMSFLCNRTILWRGNQNHVGVISDLMENKFSPCRIRN